MWCLISQRNALVLQTIKEWKQDVQIGYLVRTCIWKKYIYEVVFPPAVPSLDTFNTTVPGILFMFRTMVNEILHSYASWSTFQKFNETQNFLKQMIRECFRVNDPIRCTNKQTGENRMVMIDFKKMRLDIFRLGYQPRRNSSIKSSNKGHKVTLTQTKKEFVLTIWLSGVRAGTGCT